jgi:hypothetical protein
MKLDVSYCFEYYLILINKFVEIAQDLSAMSFRIEQSIVKTRTYSFFNNHPANVSLLKQFYYCVYQLTNECLEST